MLYADIMKFSIKAEPDTAYRLLTTCRLYHCRLYHYDILVRKICDQIDNNVEGVGNGLQREIVAPGAGRTHSVEVLRQQLLRCQYLYFCTSKASKLSTCSRVSLTMKPL